MTDQKERQPEDFAFHNQDGSMTCQAQIRKVGSQLPEKARQKEKQQQKPGRSRTAKVLIKRIKGNWRNDDGPVVVNDDGVTMYDEEGAEYSIAFTAKHNFLYLEHWQLSDILWNDTALEWLDTNTKEVTRWKKEKVPKKALRSVKTSKSTKKRKKTAPRTKPKPKRQKRNPSSKRKPTSGTARTKPKKHTSTKLHSDEDIPLAELPKTSQKSQSSASKAASTTPYVGQRYKSPRRSTITLLKSEDQKPKDELLKSQSPINSTVSNHVILAYFAKRYKDGMQNSANNSRKCGIGIARGRVLLEEFNTRPEYYVDKYLEQQELPDWIQKILDQKNKEREQHQKAKESKARGERRHKNNRMKDLVDGEGMRNGNEMGEPEDTNVIPGNLVSPNDSHIKEERPVQDVHLLLGLANAATFDRDSSGILHKPEPLPTSPTETCVPPLSPASDSDKNIFRFDSDERSLPPEHSPKVPDGPLEAPSTSSPENRPPLPPQFFPTPPSRPPSPNRYYSPTYSPKSYHDEDHSDAETATTVSWNGSDSLPSEQSVYPQYRDSPREQLIQRIKYLDQEVKTLQRDLQLQKINCKCGAGTRVNKKPKKITRSKRTDCKKSTTSSHSGRSRKSGPKRTSPVWQHFEDHNDHVVCKHCTKKLRRNFGGISMMKYHYSACKRAPRSFDLKNEETLSNGCTVKTESMVISETARPPTRLGDESSTSNLGFADFGTSSSSKDIEMCDSNPNSTPDQYGCFYTQDGFENLPSPPLPAEPYSDDPPNLMLEPPLVTDVQQSLPHAQEALSSSQALPPAQEALPSSQALPSVQEALTSSEDSVPSQRHDSYDQVSWSDAAETPEEQTSELYKTESGMPDVSDIDSIPSPPPLPGLAGDEDDSPPDTQSQEPRFYVLNSRSRHG